VWVVYWLSASLLPFMALVGANIRSGPFAFWDKLARSIAVLMSLYWIITYFPTVQQDFKNKNGDVRLFPSFPPSLPSFLPAYRAFPFI